MAGPPSRDCRRAASRNRYVTACTFSAVSQRCAFPLDSRRRSMATRGMTALPNKHARSSVSPQTRVAHSRVYGESRGEALRSLPGVWPVCHLARLVTSAFALVTPSRESPHVTQASQALARIEPFEIAAGYFSAAISRAARDAGCLCDDDCPAGFLQIQTNGATRCSANSTERRVAGARWLQARNTLPHPGRRPQPNPSRPRRPIGWALAHRRPIQIRTAPACDRRYVAPDIRRMLAACRTTDAYGSRAARTSLPLRLPIANRNYWSATFTICAKRFAPRDLFGRSRSTRSSCYRTTSMRYGHFRPAMRTTRRAGLTSKLNSRARCPRTSARLRHVAANASAESGSAGIGREPSSTRTISRRMSITCTSIQ